MKDRTVDGDFVKSVREKLGCRQDEFARVCGNATASVSRWETGDSVPEDETLELIEALDRRLEDCDDPDVLRKKLLLVSDLLETYDVLRFLENGELDEKIEHGIDDLGILEEHYLQSGLAFFDLTQRRIDWWLEQALGGAIDVRNPEAWQEVLRFVPYIERLVSRVLERQHQVHPSDAVLRKLGRALGKFLRHETIQDEKRDHEDLPNRGVPGYLDDLLEAIAALVQHLDEIGEEDGGTPAKGIEYQWDHLWPGDETLQETLEHLVNVVNDRLLEAVGNPDRWEELHDRLT